MPMKVIFRGSHAVFYCMLFTACSLQKKIGQSAQALILNDTALRTAHTGITIYDPATNKYLYNYQGNKYFVPASNTKIPTCYAAMKYLGDSLKGLKYFDTDSILFIQPTADPTLLHRDYQLQPVYTFLMQQQKKLAFIEANWQAGVYGSGWAWNDFGESYMTERSSLPIYGNTIEFKLQEENKIMQLAGDIPFFKHQLNPRVDQITKKIQIKRRRLDNIFDILPSQRDFTTLQIPFRTYENSRLFEDSLKKTWLDNVYPPVNLKYKIVYSQPTDSLLKPMMHRSDNFFAEQALLMVSNEVLSVMNDSKIIDTILKTDFKELPQKPRWADGSGLSRYNLFTPQDFIVILNKMKNEFGIERMKELFPTGGEGTLSSFYKKDSGYFYAKTGTLSGVVALSGFLFTTQKKLLLFSVLVNNHQASSTAVRKAVEKY
jgi:D-alanyl-D-alanine carboxypeptidase/D-alanyl-D-alanine-endopeptidase (penicillin-binding protein 4)